MKKQPSTPQISNDTPELLKAKQKAQWVLPIASMLEADILSRFRRKPKELSAVLIGTWNRGFVEANAFRIACTKLGIIPGRVFIIEINPVVVDQSIAPAIREQLAASLSEIEEASSFINKGIVKLDDADFRVYTATTFKSNANENDVPIVFIKGDAADPSLAATIMEAIPKDSSFVVISRNIDPGPFSYQKVIQTWAEQLNERSNENTLSLMAFTATDTQYAKRMYADIYEGLPKKASLDTDDVTIQSPELGLLLSCPPNLLLKGANFSDTRLHIIAKDRSLVGHSNEKFPAHYVEKIIQDEQAVKAIVQAWHSAHLKVVVTDGVMDIPTSRHPEALRCAANLGDKLILRMDTDEYISSFKDTRGPINPWKLRALHVAHYPYVDLIIPKLNESTAWLEVLKPDIIVKSTTSYAGIEQDIVPLESYLDAAGAQLVVFDEKLAQVPRDRITQRAKQYEQEKELNISGSNIKLEVLRRNK